MTDFESPESIDQVLNPIYWGGHSIGYGETVNGWPNLPPGGPGPRQSEKILKQRLAKMPGVLALETFKEGEVFDAKRYEPGTVVLYRDEKLMGREKNVPLDVESLKGQDLAPRPVELSASFGQEGTNKYFGSHRISYSTTARLAVVALNVEDECVLHSVVTSQVIKLGSRLVSVASPLIGLDINPIEIGKSQHFRQPYSDREQVLRVNLLQVVAYGEPIRQESRLGRIVSRWSLGGSTS